MHKHEFQPNAFLLKWFPITLTATVDHESYEETIIIDKSST